MSACTTTTPRQARNALHHLNHEETTYRLLISLLTFAPTPAGKEQVAVDIVEASGHEDGLESLAKFYETGLLLPMKAASTDAVSFHPTRDIEISLEADLISVDLEAAKRDSKKIKKYAMFRDNYRCLVTGHWEFSMVGSFPAINAAMLASETPFETATQAAHILPVSLMGTCHTQKSLFDKCSIWAVIQSFIDVTFAELIGDNINCLQNVITIDGSVRAFFASLNLWFEAVEGDIPNKYRVRKSRPTMLKGLEVGREVTFTTSDASRFPLPDRRYLAFHAAVAQVVHAAGLAEHLDKILQAQEEYKVVSCNEAADYLATRLQIIRQNQILFH